jgi:tetratricopeptide (TPR) repeat protein
VDVVDLSAPGPIAQLMVHTDGTIDSGILRAGIYEFRVIGQHGDTLAKSLWSVPSGRDLEIRLPDESVPAGGAVSTYRLSHKVPGKARKQFEKSEKAAKEGKTEAARNLLDEAIQADPEFADALHARGVIALKALDVPGARNLLVKAAELDDANADYRADAAVATYLSKATPQAEQLARSALRMDPENRKAHYVLGLALLRQGKRGDEAVRSLRTAAPTYPRAGELLQRLAPATQSFTGTLAQQP